MPAEEIANSGEKADKFYEQYVLMAQPFIKDGSRTIEEKVKETVAKVQALNLKKHFPEDHDSRALEDGLCLVFLEFQFAELAAKTAGDKMVNALQKSWKKMTPAAREQAMKLNYGSRELALIERALGRLTAMTDSQ